MAKISLSKIKITFYTIFIFITLLTVWSFNIEPALLLVKKIDLTLPEFKKNTEIKIVIIADLHIGMGTMDLKRLEKVVNTANKENPDIIVNLGDYHSYTIARSNIPVEKVTKILSKLKAKYGVYSILGNHDGVIGSPKTLKIQKKLVTDIIKKANIKLLDDSFEVLNIDGNSFILLGLTDYSSTMENYFKNYYTNNLNKADYPNLAKTSKALPKGLPVILLNHSPDIFPETPDQVSITLAGHTHGCHFNIPVIKTLIAPSIYGDKYCYGLIKEKNHYMYVTSGTGGFPLRIGIPPEIVVLNIKGSGQP